MRLIRLRDKKPYAVTLTLTKQDLKDLEQALSTEIEEMEDFFNSPQPDYNVSYTELQRFVTLRETVKSSLTSLRKKR